MLETRSVKRLRDEAWTGGQYSLYRVFLGLCMLAITLAVHSGATHLLESSLLGSLVRLIPAGMALSPLVFTLPASAAALLLILGWRDRLATILLFLLLPLLWREGMNVRLTGPLHFLLVLHFATPSAPYGSLSAWGRSDPGGAWAMPRSVTAAAWAFFVPFMLSIDLFTDQLPLYFSGIGATLLLFERTRPWGWGVFLLGEGIRLAIEPSWGHVATLPIFLLCFRPNWLPRASGNEPELLFYDGYCGLCHRLTRLLLAEDRDGKLFRYSPLQGETLSQFMTDQERAQLPDSVVLRSRDQRFLIKSDAALACADRLGGWWRLLAKSGLLLPRTFRNGIYDFIASVRHRLFARPTEVCPLIPVNLRARFLP